MRDDWSHHFLEVERYKRKAKDTLVAAQSIGSAGQKVAYVQAEIHLLEAINSLREVVASVRALQKHPGSF